MLAFHGLKPDCWTDGLLSATTLSYFGSHGIGLFPSKHQQSSSSIF